MGQLKSDGAETLPKIQKNAQLDSELCDVLEDMQVYTGATHSRIVTAALLKYMFSSLQPPPDVTGYTDDRMWMRIAVELERGDFTIYEVPRRVLERSLELSEVAIAELERLGKPTKETEQRKSRWIALRGAGSKVLRRWDNTVADFKGERAALRQVLERGGFPTLQAVGYAGQPDGPLSQPKRPTDA